MSSFAADLTKFVKKANGNIDKVVQKVGFDLARGVIKRTPVDTGRARANWQVGETMPAFAIDAKDNTQTGSRAIKSAKDVIKHIKAGGVFYIANNVEYIRELEYGSSKQAPQGMMRITVKMYHQYLANAVRSLK